MNDSLALPTPPSAARVFFGFRSARFRETPGEDPVAAAKKRMDFFAELGSTFMPGTPLMQAPLGLMAYLPAVVDPKHDEGLPDEVALIIYVSNEVYQSTRSSSLSRRMYTRSHYAVFDMEAAVADFPAPVAAPRTVQSSLGPVDLWHLFDRPSDWQDGSARLLLLRPATEAADFRLRMSEAARSAAATLEGTGCDQVIAACTDGFAFVWLHSRGDVAALDLSGLTSGTKVVRDLSYQSALVRGDMEAGVAITGASAFNWRFARDLRYF